MENVRTMVLRNNFFYLDSVRYPLVGVPHTPNLGGYPLTPPILIREKHGENFIYQFND